jgi:hypothetical protein
MQEYGHQNGKPIMGLISVPAYHSSVLDGIMRRKKSAARGGTSDAMSFDYL